jgi:hypothetical protein
MANSKASISIKPIVAFNRGDTFVFGSWVCTADGAGFFQRRLTMAPNPSTGLVMLPGVITGELARKFGEISLYNQHADFEFGSASNSNSTSPSATACEPAIEPSCADFPLHEHFPYGLCNTSKAHAKFDFGSDPNEPESENSTTEQPLSGPATGLVITSTPVGRFVYWPDRKRADLTGGNSRCVAYLDSLPFQESSSRGAHFNRGGDCQLQSRHSISPSLLAAGETSGPSGTHPDRYFEDISADEMSANAPADETSDDKNARHEHNRKRNERRRRLRESLPIRNLKEALDQVESRGAHYP